MLSERACADLILAIERAHSAESLTDAVEQLSQARYQEGITTLIEVLGYNNPAAAAAAVEGLIQLGESAVLPLLSLIDGYNYGARAWAIRALASIADPRGLEVLLEAATTDFSFSVRRAATKGLGFIQWSLISDGDRRLAAQIKALGALLKTVDDEEWVVRYAAIVSLQRLAEIFALARLQGSVLPERVYLKQIHTCFNRMRLEDSQLIVKARVAFARQQLQQFAEFADLRHPNFPTTATQ